jgi:hypothetical protein
MIGSGVMAADEAWCFEKTCRKGNPRLNLVRKCDKSVVSDRRNADLDNLVLLNELRATLAAIQVGSQLWILKTNDTLTALGRSWSPSVLDERLSCDEVSGSWLRVGN